MGIEREQTGRVAGRSRLSAVPGYEPDRVTDPELVARLATGDGDAMADLWQRYSRPCLALARRITGDEVLCDEVVQEVFLALWRKPTAYDPTRGAFVTWLLATTHHKSVDAVRREDNHRRRRASSEILIEQESDEPRTDEAAWLLVRRDRVRAALASLPPVQKEALGLAYFGGYTQREIAGLTQTPLGTVKTRMLAGMRRMRESLEAAVTDLPRSFEVGTADPGQSS
jgi:RNA polymerase sigma factor (sigma-70 family)